MANIITMLEKEVQKENVYLDTKGNFISIEKIEDIARKSYILDLKDGSISFDVTYYEYVNGIMKDYIPLSVITNFIKDTLRYGLYEDEKSVGDLIPTADPMTPVEYCEKVAN